MQDVGDFGFTHLKRERQTASQGERKNERTNERFFFINEGILFFILPSGKKTKQKKKTKKRERERKRECVRERGGGERDRDRQRRRERSHIGFVSHYTQCPALTF